MRQEFLDRLQQLLIEKTLGTWKDGWVYGRLREEFETLGTDELEKMVRDLGFSLGWNPTLRVILERQWDEDRLTWEPQERKRIYQEQERVRLRQEQERLRLQQEQIRQEVAKKKVMELELISRELEQFKDTLAEAGSKWPEAVPWFESSSDLLQDTILELDRLSSDLLDVRQWSNSQAFESSRRALLASNREAEAYHNAQNMAYTRLAESLDAHASKIKTRIDSTTSRLKTFLSLLENPK